MLKLCYKCHYDGNKCDREIPKFTENAELIPPSNKKIKEKYERICSGTDDGWDACDGCPRNYSMGVVCWGRLAVENGGTIEKL